MEKKGLNFKSPFERFVNFGSPSVFTHQEPSIYSVNYNLRSLFLRGNATTCNSVQSTLLHVCLLQLISRNYQTEAPEIILSK